MLKTGAAAELTVRLADAWAAVGKFDVSVLVVLLIVPAESARRVTTIVQLAPEATVPLARLIAVAPVAPVSVPPQLFTGAVAATTRPDTDGSLKSSLNAMLVAAIGLAVLSMVSVRVVSCPCSIVAGENTFENPTTAAVTLVSPSVALLLAVFGSLTALDIVAVFDNSPVVAIAST